MTAVNCLDVEQTRIKVSWSIPVVILSRLLQVVMPASESSLLIDALFAARGVQWMEEKGEVFLRPGSTKSTKQHSVSSGQHIVFRFSTDTKASCRAHYVVVDGI